MMGQPEEEGRGCRRPWGWRWPDRRLLLLLGVAAGVRLLVAPYHGFLADLQTYVDWGELARHHVTDLYSAGEAAFHQGRLVFPTNYPPLTLELDAAIVQAVSGTGVGLSVHDSGWLAAWAKAPAIAADLACIALLWGWGQRVAGRRAAITVAGLYAFCPAVLVDGAVWGQTDTVSACLLLATALAAMRGRVATAGALLAVAVVLKPQPVVVLPVVAVFLGRRWGRGALSRGFAAAAATVLLVWSPMLVTGHLGEVGAFAGNLSETARLYPASSFNAFNLWWLVGAADVHHSSAYLGPLSIDSVGTALTVAVIGGVCTVLWRLPAERLLLLGMAVAVTAFFVLGSLQHERYLVPALALLAASCVYGRTEVGLFAATTLTVTLNLLLVVLPSLDAAERGGLPDWLFASHSTTAQLVAAANLLLLVAMGARFLRTAGAAGAGVGHAGRPTDGEGAAAVS